MINCLNKWKNKIRIKRCGIHKAEEKDIDFVIEQIVEGAKKRHFIEAILIPDEQNKYRNMLLGLVNGYPATSLSAKEVETKWGQLWMYGNNKDGNIGFFLIMEKYEGSGFDEIELLMASIKKESQGFGHGTNLINFFKTLCQKQTTLYARCYFASESMCKILLRAGFVKTNTTPEGTRELEYKKI
ncbi:hypothetical protein DO021_22520 [Desulfobacter hydrogenophilus]|uniref:N-acetyltransferase domain-containing protein n=1 Tax=Desulfobacter hydrogenophilus TaxID=2291 RepID=A0A328F5K1_9BACT|nr:hypothetical protein [Desulfobacter hydrogenophilus]NDY74664.1 hypothetical protein [Desulfobacter hydrogenophilus]QBH14277.1 hypothetical protein EYB58_15965 [Desulfobacter hydrogenophilus]RAL99803.1 hypothetical protein DO021_22520 [Desulfobacter hydrogenophilus]